jgi:hypothetical protein
MIPMITGDDEEEEEDEEDEEENWLEKYLEDDGGDDEAERYREYWMFMRGPELRHYWESRTRTLGEIALGIGALAAAIDSKPNAPRSQVADVLFALASAVSAGHWDALAADAVRDAVLLKALHTPAVRHLRKTGEVPTTLAEFGRRLSVELVLFILREVGRASGARKNLWIKEDPTSELASLVAEIRTCRTHAEIVAIADRAATRNAHANDGDRLRLCALFFAWCDSHGVYRDGAAAYFGQWLHRKGARFALFTDVSADEIAQRLAPFLESELFHSLPREPDAVADLAQRALRTAGLSAKVARNIIHAADDMREKRRARSITREGD